MSALMEEISRSNTSFLLSGEIVAPDYAERFRKHHRVRIPEPLQPAGAIDLYQHLASEVRWRSFLVANETMYEVPSDLDASGSPAHEAFVTAYESAGRGFASLHDASGLFSEDDPQGRSIETAQDASLLRELRAFTNAPSFLDLCRQVTGRTQVSRTEVRATRYRSGQFTGFHTMLPYSTRNGRRVAGFELTLTPEWRPEWGGLHEFMLREDYGSEGWLPSFNVLDIFGLSRGHWISCVAPRLPCARLAIGGWMYES